MALAQDRRIDLVLVTELTRWGRSTIDLVQTLQALQAWGVSLIAQTAALASLNQTDELLRRVAAVRDERTRVMAAARALGYDIPDSRANFYWVPLGHAAESFAHRCREHGVTVRAFPDEGVRITVGEPDANDRVLSLLGQEG